MYRLYEINTNWNFLKFVKNKTDNLVQYFFLFNSKTWIVEKLTSEVSLILQYFSDSPRRLFVPVICLSLVPGLSLA